VSHSTNSETFDILRTFQSSVVAKLSDLKNSLFFGPPCTDSSVGSQSVRHHRSLQKVQGHRVAQGRIRCGRVTPRTGGPVGRMPSMELL